MEGVIISTLLKCDDLMLLTTRKISALNGVSHLTSPAHLVIGVSHITPVEKPEFELPSCTVRGALLLLQHVLIPRIEPRAFVTGTSAS